MKNLVINPVLNKEFKLRFRTFKSFLGIFFYLLALGILIIGFVFIQSLSNNQGYFKPDQSKDMFMILSVLQLALILFITPGLTAGVISSERERQTLNMMLTTTQSSTSIILSKLISSISFLLLLIIASLPLYSIVFLFGGISPGQVLMTIGFYTFTIITYGSLGVLFSTLIRKTVVAMVTTYGVTLFLAGGTAFLTLILMQLNQGFYNPAAGTTNPLPYFTAMLNPPIVLLGTFQPEITKELMRGTGIDFPIWISFLISNTVIMVGAVVLSIIKLRPNMKRG
ncbi:ABC transporter permease [Litchfieldia salsa]|uniref:ABC-2 family transporter protein n=1 Tax=Litchfieldia salsa TaxID=930152 RepID=A0A1H0WMM0_9BACI|nr:ABC transporter permease subunit [Litchfieldia salsa]SDP91954.1 ABC-2 family transporter protein [Litchfieldia salsa]